jgi:hypothetical protein
VAGKNDSGAAEYDQVIGYPMPTGPHRVALDNSGADWLGLTWLEFQGTFSQWEVFPVCRDTLECAGSRGC